MLNTPAYWIFQEDIADRNLADWLAAHTTGFPPLHRYEGQISLSEGALHLQGTDKWQKERVELVIPKATLEQLYLGFDEHFTVAESRGLGLMWQPLRIRFSDGSKVKLIYLILNYRLGFTDNQQWFDTLQQWVS